jgi:hypothetical protein
MAVSEEMVTLTGTSTQRWSIDITRSEAIEYLIDAGADEADIKDLPMADLIAGMIDRDNSDFADEITDRLEDYASEVDSSGIEWEIDA